MADQGLDLNAYLAELEDQRAKLDIQIAGVRARLGLDEVFEVTLPTNLSGPTSRDATVTGRVRSDEFFRMSIPEAIKRYLEIMKKPQTPTGIVSALKAGGVLSQSKNFYTTVATAIKRLRIAGEIVNTPSGWGLSVWYPNKPKAGEERTKKGRGKKSRKRSKPAQAKKLVGDRTPLALIPPSGYNAFVAEQRRAGKSMQEIGAAWRKKKAES